MSAPDEARRVTRRELPSDGHELEALAPAEREALALHWLERAALELRVGRSFEAIALTLTELGAPEPLQQLARRAIDDEHRHHALCVEVASRFAGRALEPPLILPFAPPHHLGVRESARRHFWVLGQCAFNETFASVVLETSLAHASGGVARCALRELLSDEVDHARIGWAHGAALTRAERFELQPRLLSVLKANVRAWRETPRHVMTGEAAMAHGVVTPELIDASLRTALTELVIPGLDQLGFDVAALARWVSEGAQT